MTADAFNPALDNQWGSIVLLVSIIAGFVGSIRLFQERRHADVAFVLLMYLLPPIIVFGLRRPLALWLYHWPVFKNADPDITGATVWFLFSPIMLFSCCWLVLGGFAVLDRRINVADLMKSHLTWHAMRHKAIGSAMMLSGVAIWVTTMLVTEPSPIRIVPFIVAFLLYTRGAFPFVFVEFDPIRRS